MTASLVTVARGVSWYLRQFTGEAKWDEYVERCRAAGTQPMPRRDFERHRADHKERSTQARCC
ncbi:MAG TPA: YbdD/YjiX family protein [Actinomycetales bacterium]|jgi:uncharacterized short protein YbdD (DUF466 family)